MMTNKDAINPIKTNNGIYVFANKNIRVKPKEYSNVTTGISINMNEGYKCLVVSRLTDKLLSEMRYVNEGNEVVVNCYNPSSKVVTVK